MATVSFLSSQSEVKQSVSVSSQLEVCPARWSFSIDAKYSDMDGSTTALKRLAWRIEFGTTGERAEKLVDVMQGQSEWGTYYGEW